MFDFFFGIALILFGLPPSGDTIAANGFEEPDVYISTDRPSGITWAIDSTPNHNASFVTSSIFLTDGKVAVPTRVQWDTGSQTMFTYVKLTASLSLTLKAGDIVVAAFLCPKTPYALPVDAAVGFELVKGGNTFGIGTNTTIVEFNSGGRGRYFAQQLIQADIDALNGSPASSVTLTGLNVFLYPFKYPSGSIWATPGENVDIGEIWLGTAQVFDALTDPKLSLIDPTLMRRSHSNQPWALYLKPYKSWTFNFAPMSDTDAYDSSSTPSFDSVRYSLSGASCAVVIPRIYVRGSTSSVDTVALNQLSCFGKPDFIGPLAMVKESGALWGATMTFGEAPP